MDNSVLIVGAFHEIIELAEDTGFNIIGLIDKRIKKLYRGYAILGDDSIADKIEKKYPVIITPDVPKIRLKLYNYYNDIGFTFVRLVSKNAKISKSAIIGDGSIIQHGVNISSECRIGKFAKCNTLCNIMHDSNIGDFTTIAPNAVILGNVKIGKYCYIGANSTILPNIILEDGVTIGAGAVVTINISAGKTVFGVPAQ